MSMILDGSNGVTFNDASLQGAAASPYVLKNRIINGAMVIDQRNAGASVTPTADAQYTLDRWKVVLTQSSKFSVQQDAGAVTPPTGFNDYLGVTSLSSYSVASGDIFAIQQNIEGYNAADLAWGTANAKTITLSFWVRSSLTGTFGGSVLNSAADRSYLFSYSIPTANTWTQISVTIAGDTSGTWLVTNGVGIAVRFSLGAGSTFSGTVNVWQAGNIGQPTGSVSVVGTNAATWYVTGVQFEIGTSATPFERRLYNQELANCQRYFEKYSATTGTPIGYVSIRTGAWYGWIPFRAEKRAAPSITLTGSFFFAGTAGDIASQTPTDINEISVYGCRPYKNTGSYTAQGAYIGVQTPSTDSLAISAEL